MGAISADEVGRVALMSIRPCYVHEILNGEKRVEFRKRPLARDVTHVLVYSTAPVSAVVGAFVIDEQVTVAPQLLWDRFADIGGIEPTAFKTYYADRSAGTGITIGAVFRTENPIRLRSIAGTQHPPQSFRYIDTAVALPLLQTMNLVEPRLTGALTSGTNGEVTHLAPR